MMTNRDSILMPELFRNSRFRKSSRSVGGDPDSGGTKAIADSSSSTIGV
nr:hypothetical protein [Leptolyngbya sp. O-77]